MPLVINPPVPELSSQPIHFFASLLLVLHLLLVVHRMLATNIRLVALPSVFLTGIAASSPTLAPGMSMWSFATLIGKSSFRGGRRWSGTKIEQKSIRG